VPSLDGGDKMSTSIISSIPIFLSDNEEQIKNKIFMIKKVGAGSLDELFNNGCNLDIDIPYKLIELFDKNEFNVDLIKKYYQKPQNNYEKDIEVIKSLVSNKGYKIKDNFLVITTFGVRTYLTKVIIDIIKKFN
jgi:tryptophanyl-tRNA synthetase